MYQQIKFTILDKIVKSEHSIILFKLIFKYTHKKTYFKDWIIFIVSTNNLI